MAFVRRIDGQPIAGSWIIHDINGRQGSGRLRLRDEMLWHAAPAKAGK